jgi:hypothetical protein
MTFTYKCMTQTQIGRLFGVTSHTIGDWLTSLGLRKDGKPTQKAHNGGYCDTAPSGQCGYHYVWKSQKTVAALKDAGHRLVPNPPQHLVAPAILRGPFSVRKSAGSDFVVENADGSASVWANTQMTADVVARILNAAHDKGVIDRLCHTQRLLQMSLAPTAAIDKIITPFDKRDGESPSLESTPHQSHNDNIL